MMLLPLHTASRAIAFVLLLLFSAVTLCAGRGLCCAQFKAKEVCSHRAEQAQEQSCEPGGDHHSCCGQSRESGQELQELRSNSCCTPAAQDKSNSHASHENSCDACSLCSHCGASIMPGLVFLSTELLPSGVSLYYPSLYATVSAVYDITEQPPNCA